jgi:hypothetical protein
MVKQAVRKAIDKIYQIYFPHKTSHFRTNKIASIYNMAI